MEKFADGGSVGFCSENREHNSDCEYYSGGGEVPSDDLPSTSAHGVVPDEDLPETQASEKEVPPEDLPDTGDGGWTEQLKAGAEGAAQGVLGPLAPMAEVGLGISTKEAINKRAKDFPLTHGVAEGATFLGSMLIGTGEAGLIAKGADAAAESLVGGAEILSTGRNIVKSAIQSSAMIGSDEITKSFLGQPGSDPEHPVGAALLNVGAVGLLGAASGGAFTLGEKLIGAGVASEAGAKAASKAQEYLFKLGQAANPVAKVGISATLSAPPAYKTAKNISDKTGLPIWMTFTPVEAVYTMIGQKALDKINPYITSAAVKALSEGATNGLPNAIEYANKVIKGAKACTSGIGEIMKPGVALIAPPVIDFARKQIKENIEDGGVDHQLQNSMQDQAQGNNFAAGGEVKSEPNQHFAKVFPEQNMLLSAAKARVSNYLSGLRPQKNQPKAAFDDAPSSKEQTRQYDKAIDLAISPLSILDHVNKGELTPEHMKHFTSMYPDVHKFLSTEMTKQITEAQLKGNKPPYSKRQAMSLFLGADLDSSFSPMAIQTIQGLYANKKAAAQQQVPTKNKKGTSTLSKISSSHQTDDQAREQRLQNQKA